MIVKVTREAHEEAWANATSLNDYAARLKTVDGQIGVHYQTARKIAAQYGKTIGQDSFKKSANGETIEEAFGSSVKYQKEVEKLKSLLREEKKVKVQALSMLQSQEDMIDRIVDAASMPREVPEFEAPIDDMDPQHSKREVVLQISDWQMGQLVRYEDTGNNEYNWDVFQERLNRWVEAVVSSIRNQRRAYYITRGVFAFGGDMVEGHDVFNGQPWQLDTDAIVQSLDGARAWAAAIDAIVTAFPDIVWEIYCVTGNHGKPGGRRGGATPSTLSFDYLFYKILEKDIENLGIDNIHVETSGALLFDSCGYTCLLTHGDEFKGYAGFPFYGLSKADSKHTNNLGMLYTYWFLGHHHRAAIIPVGWGDRIVNGDAVGPNNLSRVMSDATSAPQQNLCFLSEKYGLSEIVRIKLVPMNERIMPVVHGRV